MKISLIKSLIISVVFLALSCSKEEADSIVVPEPTSQELILGTWSIDSAYSDIYSWTFEEGEATVTFRQDSVMVFQNNGSQTIIPLEESQQMYHIEKICWITLDLSCPAEERIDVLITNSIYNSLQFIENNNKLIFGQAHQDGIQYYCSKINDDL